MSWTCDEHIDGVKRCDRCVEEPLTEALDSVIDAWQADAGTNALRNSPAMCRAIAKAREVRGR